MPDTEELLKKLFVVTTIVITFLSSFSYLVSIRVLALVSQRENQGCWRLSYLIETHMYLTPESVLLFYCIIQLHPFWMVFMCNNSWFFQTLCRENVIIFSFQVKQQVPRVSYARPLPFFLLKMRISLFKKINIDMTTMQDMNLDQDWLIDLFFCLLVFLFVCLSIAIKDISEIITNIWIRSIDHIIVLYHC